MKPGATFGVWEGWGTSLCWWAQAFGERDDLADVFFTLGDKVEVKEGFSVPGLGLTIGRYNAGASSDAPAGGEHMEKSPNVSPTRLLQAFWTTWEGSSPGESGQPPLEGVWDWSMDASQRSMMQKAAARGADKMQLFSNSPVWWQTASHNPSGGKQPSKDNLPAAHYDDHAAYMAQATPMRGVRVWWCCCCGP